MDANLWALLNTVDEFGVMHIVVGDGNMDDCNLDFVQAQMDEHGASDDERKLLALLRTMTVDERDEAWGEWAYG